ncbi:MAG: DegT/DnrJ/EryC1/StrS family aminotransferase [Gaiellaceae bacterium]
MTVPFGDLARQTAALRPELDEAVDRVFRSGRYLFGDELERFEAAFAAWCGAAQAIGVANGTDAVTIALQAAGVEPGDEVITAANTCVPTIVGIENAGAVPVLVDAEPATRTLDPALAAAAVTARTRALLPVHLYGQAADLEPLRRLADERGLALVEDAAQAHGAEVGDRRVGSLGDTAAFSFYPTKNLGALGDGGAVVTNDPAAAEQARLLRNYGERDRFEHVLRGRNSRLDALQAAILALKLTRLDEWTARRRAIAARYTAALKGTPVRAPRDAPGRSHVYHLYVVEAPERDRFRGALASAGVATAVHYPCPVHLQPAYRALGEGRSLPVAERLTETVVSLPLYPELSDDEVERVAVAARSAGLEQPAV